MYEKSNENQSVRIFVGPFTVGDPVLSSVWFLSSDLGMPRILPAFAIAGGMLTSAIRSAFQRLVLWATEQKDAARVSTKLKPVPVRQESNPISAANRRNEAA
ncbi:MAG: hypothetical protein IT364_26550 [Candidatus Hydrogenedentes bacterium]|nr:hypothetical protein [Candidatus Hydrogenedentota bacterium]